MSDIVIKTGHRREAPLPAYVGVIEQQDAEKPTVETMGQYTVTIDKTRTPNRVHVSPHVNPRIAMKVFRTPYFGSRTRDSGQRNVLGSVARANGETTAPNESVDCYEVDTTEALYMLLEILRDTLPLITNAEEHEDRRRKRNTVLLLQEMKLRRGRDGVTDTICRALNVPFHKDYDVRNKSLRAWIKRMSK